MRCHRPILSRLDGVDNVGRGGVAESLAASVIIDLAIALIWPYQREVVTKLECAGVISQVQRGYLVGPGVPRNEEIVRQEGREANSHLMFPRSHKHRQFSYDDSKLRRYNDWDLKHTKLKQSVVVIRCRNSSTHETLPIICTPKQGTGFPRRADVTSMKTRLTDSHVYPLYIQTRLREGKAAPDATQEPTFEATSRYNRKLQRQDLSVPWSLFARHH